MLDSTTENGNCSSNTDMEDSENSPHLDQELTNNSNDTNIKVDPKNLTNIEKLLYDNAWLTDYDILNFMNILKKKFPNINGMEDPIIISHRPENLKKK